MASAPPPPLTRLLAHLHSLLTTYTTRIPTAKDLIWCSYRTGIPEIISDTGWGCMIRTAQMLLANTIMGHWKVQVPRREMKSGDVQESTGSKEEPKNREGIEEHEKDKETEKQSGNEIPLQRDAIENREKYVKIMKAIADDDIEAPFGIHSILKAGQSKAGDWYGPVSVGQAIHQCICQSDLDMKSLFVNDQVIIQDQVFAAAWPQRSQWTPILVLLPFRLGVTLNSVYFPALKAVYELSSCRGIIGGQPNRAFYFIECNGDDLIYLDPHTTQDVVQSGKSWGLYSSYHSEICGQCKIDQIAPSLLVGFYLKDKEAWDELVTWHNKLKSSGVETFFSIRESAADYSVGADEMFDDDDDEDGIK